MAYFIFEKPVYHLGGKDWAEKKLTCVDLMHRHDSSLVTEQDILLYVGFLSSNILEQKKEMQEN